MDKKTAIRRVVIVVGMITIAYLLYRFYRADDSAPYDPSGNWYMDPRTTINHPDNV